LREQLKANTMLGGQVYKAGPGIKPPTVIHPTRDPEYSEEARKARIQGEVALAIVVDVDGRPKNIKVVRSVGHGLDEESMRAIKHWRFNPGTKDGVPVPVQVDVTMNFRLGFF